MKPKKSLGQNFLKDRSVLEKIIEAANLKADDL
ncbi:MAG TPA: rRNA adenine N-6-methyltransferase family protein, partial [Patescibacteria group bacterium]|nr:rRNA adenine N-6-methyltransferase family protein [Patescibacteria group bacterium]